MDKKYAYFVYVGLLIGVMFASMLGSTNVNAVIRLGSGALAGAGLGWFAAVIATQQNNTKK